MKTALVPAILGAALVAAILVWRSTRTPEVATSDPRVPAAATPLESAVPLSKEAPVSTESARSEVPPQPTARPAQEAAALPQIAQAIPEAAEETKQDDVSVEAAFAQKYASMDARARLRALDSLRSVLESGAGAGSGGGQGMTEEQVLELKREVEWLANNSSP
jgi:hypothetical protein